MNCLLTRQEHSQTKLSDLTYLGEELRLARIFFGQKLFFLKLRSKFVEFLIYNNNKPHVNLDRLKRQHHLPA